MSALCVPADIIGRYEEYPHRFQPVYYVASFEILCCNLRLLYRIMKWVTFWQKLKGLHNDH